ncbi:MAG: methyl-accepting chemotaxis protein, partial [Motiliproteus sp.]
GADAMGDNTLGVQIQKLQGLVKSREVKADLARFNEVRKSYVTGLEQMHTALTERNTLIQKALFEIGPQITAEIEQLKAADEKHQLELAHQVEAIDSQGMLLVSIFSAIAITLGIAIAYFLPRSIRKPIGGEPRDIQALANKIAEGDLTVEYSHTGNESGIYVSMREMTEKLSSIVDDVTDASGSVSSASGQIAAGSQELSQRTEEQASSLEETAASIEELTATVKTNADNAMQANQLAEGARDKAVAGGMVVKDAQQAMDEVSTASNQIKEIIEVIEGISFQTNLLSLNASVEAARAGEQGRGFAVVAAEVGKLASKSSDAAKDIKGLINSTVTKVESGAALVTQSGTALQEIIASVTKVTDIVAEISAASQEQAAGISQVNKAITQMDEVTQHNASQVEETAAAAEALNEQASHLRELVGFFTTTNTGQKQAAIRATASSQLAASTPRPAKARSAAKPVAKTADEDGWDKY